MLNCSEQIAAESVSPDTSAGVYGEKENTVFRSAADRETQGDVLPPVFLS
jgi:hypothetical protein